MSESGAAHALPRAEMSANLRASLQRAVSYADQQSHRQVALEHLLLALVDDRESAVILESSALDIPALMADVSDYLHSLDDRVAGGAAPEPAIGGAVQHIFQSAAAAAEKSGRRTISSALVLAAIVGEGRSPAAQMLRNRGLTFEAAIKALKSANAAASQSARQPSAPLAPPAPVSAPAPATVTPAPAADTARLQNVQAAHEIIAHARERIAAARGAIASSQADAVPQPAQRVAAPQPTPPEPPAAVQLQPRPPASQSQPAAASSQHPQPPPPPAARPVPEAQPQPQPAPSYPLPPAPPVEAGAPRHPSQLSEPRRPPAGYAPQPATQPHPQPAQHPQYRHPPQHPQHPQHQQPPRYAPPAAQFAPQPQPQPSEARFPPPAEAPANPIEPEHLIEHIPTRMRIGAASTVVVRAPRARLEAWSGANTPDQQVITKAMAMRLKAPEGGFTIEIASPETQWSEGTPGPLADEIVSWRWTVTPTRSGRYPLSVLASTRVVGRDGLAAARSLPEQTVSVRVAPNYGRALARLAVWIMIAASGAAAGYYGERLFSMGRSVLAEVMR